MESINFCITKNEVEKLAGTELSVARTDAVLKMVENDPVLWKEIERSIVFALENIPR